MPDHPRAATVTGSSLVGSTFGWTYPLPVSLLAIVLAPPDFLRLDEPLRPFEPLTACPALPRNSDFILSTIPFTSFGYLRHHARRYHLALLCTSPSDARNFQGDPG